MPPETGPDQFLVMPQPDPRQRLTDGGPRYQETPLDPALLPRGNVAEPFNTVTASFFILIVIWWVIRLRGRYRQYSFLTSMLPILLAGGVGGTLYHAFRTQKAYFLLDVIPIQILGLAGAVYLTIRLSRGSGWVSLGLTIFGLMTASLVLGFVFFRAFSFNLPNLPVNLSYLTLATLIVIPIGLYLWRTRFAHIGWVLAGLACFAHAWFFRLVDNTGMVNIPMGTHWLWHIYGAATTVFIFEYFYRLMKDANAAGVDANQPSPPQYRAL